MLRGIFNLNKSWEAHPTKRELYANIPPNTKKIKERRVIFA